MLLKKQQPKTLDPDGRILLKQVYSVQGCQPAEHCKKRSLKKLITATRRDYTWKSTTKSGIVWQNWTQNRVVEGAKSMHRSTVLCNSGLPPKNLRIHERQPQIHPSYFHSVHKIYFKSPQQEVKTPFKNLPSADDDHKLSTRNNPNINNATCTKTAAVSQGTSHVTTKQYCNHISGYSKCAV